MNGHASQSIEATTECRILMRAASHIVTAQRNGPVDGPVQDALVGIYMLTNTWSGTNPDTMVKKSDYFNILLESGIEKKLSDELMKRAEKYYPDYIQNGRLVAEEIPGKLFASVLFPCNFTYKKKTDICPFAPIVRIKNGVIKPNSGPLDKTVVGAKQCSIIHYLWKDYSPEVSLKFISNVQQITNRWLPIQGFSVGHSDFMHDSELEIQEKIQEAKKNVAKINLESKDQNEIEMDIRMELNGVMNVGLMVGSKGMAKGDKNAMNVMRNAGAKGTAVNLTQISCLVGQQNLSGGRIPKTLSNKSRGMVHFEMGDNSPEARGFVTRSYKDGLKPTEFFFHAMTGRQGIVATGVKTSETGYIQKRIGKKVEDYMVWVDGSVRDANGRIIQFLYGDDGFDAKKIYSVEGIKYPTFINVPFRMNMLNYDGEGDKRELTEDEIDVLLGYIKSGGDIVENPITKQQTENVRKAIREQLKNTQICEDKIPDFIFDARNIFETSKAQHGDMVGAIAASSLGEPVTQLTLNLFHFSGVGGKDVSVGVPRFNEILNATKPDKQKKPICSVRFQDGVDGGSFGKLFPEVHVSTVLKDYDMEWVGEREPESSPVDIISYSKYEKSWWVKMKESFGEKLPAAVSWVLVLNFDVSTLVKLDTTLEMIASSLNEQSEGKYVCVASPLCFGRIEVFCSFDKMRKEVLKGISGSNSFRNEANIDFFICRDVLLEFVKKIKIFGVKGVMKTHYEKDDKGDLVTLSLSKMTLIGAVNRFLAILTTKGVDPLRTICDDMHSIYSVLGIEATRKFLMKEVERLISFDGTYVNKRHIQILVDSMTHTGEITSVRRDGIPRDVGAIAKILFEDAIPNAVQSAVFGETDKKKSISASVMLGSLCRAGTGSVRVIRENEVPSKKVILKPGFIPKDEKKKKKPDVIEI